MNTGRSGFQAVAHTAFDYLCSELGFGCVLSDSSQVRYESPVVFFETGYSDSYDCEVYARIGRLDVPGILPEERSERIDFGLFLSVCDPETYKKFSVEFPANIAHSEEEIKRVLSYFCEGLKRHGMPLLTADDETYVFARGLRFWHSPGFPPEALSHAE